MTERPTAQGSSSWVGSSRMTLKGSAVQQNGWAMEGSQDLTDTEYREFNMFEIVQMGAIWINIEAIEYIQSIPMATLRCLNAARSH